MNESSVDRGGSASDREAETEGNAARVARDVLEAAPLGVQVIGFDFEYVYVNPLVAEQGRNTCEGLRGRRMVDCYPGIDASPMFARLRRCVTERVAERMENAFTYENGDVRWFELRFFPVPQGACIVSIDITERKLAEDALRRGEEALRRLLDGARDYAIFELDPAGRVATWNGGAQRLFCLTAEQVVGTSVADLRADGDGDGEDPAALLAAANDTGSASREGWYTREGGRFWAVTVITRLHDAEGRVVGFAALVRDRTDRRALEEQYRQAQKMEAVGRLAAGVAHDFNNLMSVILGYASLVRSRLPRHDDLREDLGEIIKAGQRAADLTRQLMAFSRQQIRRLEIVDINASIAKLDRLLRVLLGVNIELRTSLAPGLAPVRLDRGQVEQIVMNLSVNARDAMPDGGVLTIETENVVFDEEFARLNVGTTPGPHVMLTVRDTGVGMDSATMRRIFEPFFTTKDVGKGTGLGLSTVYGIVQQNGGSIRVSSAPKQGAVFRVCFPLSDLSPSDSDRPAESPSPAQGETILVVDDEAQLRQLAQALLQRQGYRVLVAANAGEALNLCEQHGADVDVLLADVVMPGMNGRALADRVRASWPAIRVIYLSGYADAAAMPDGALPEGAEFLSKPVMPEELLRTIRRVLAGSPRPT